MQVIATKSSSFDLASKTGEALTGRVYPFELFPLSLVEIAGSQGYSVIEPRLERLLCAASKSEILPKIFRVGVDRRLATLPGQDAGVKANATPSNL